jgi:hypothetical protein
MVTMMIFSPFAIAQTEKAEKISKKSYNVASGNLEDVLTSLALQANASYLRIP